MIKGHEIETFDLTQKELGLAMRLIPYLKQKTKDNPVQSKDIIKGLKEKWGYDLKPERLRKIVNFYRTNSIIPILSNSTGYFVSYDKTDIETFGSSMVSRSNSIMCAVIGLQRIAYRKDK